MPVRFPIQTVVEQHNRFLEENEFPYRLDEGYFLKLMERGFNDKEVFSALDQCKRHLGIDKEKELEAKT